MPDDLRDSLPYIQDLVKGFNIPVLGVDAWSLGCLKNIEEDEDWLRGNLTNWNHAFAIIHFFPNGNYVVQVVEIIKGKTNLWGEELNGSKR